MDGSLGQFKATLQRRKERSEKHKARNNGTQADKSVSGKVDFEFPKFSEEELENLKLKLRKKKKRQRIIFYVLIIAAFSTAFYFLYSHNLL